MSSAAGNKLFTIFTFHRQALDETNFFGHLIVAATGKAEAEARLRGMMQAYNERYALQIRNAVGSEEKSLLLDILAQKDDDHIAFESARAGSKNSMRDVKAVARIVHRVLSACLQSQINRGPSLTDAIFHDVAAEPGMPSHGTVTKIWKDHKSAAAILTALHFLEQREIEVDEFPNFCRFVAVGLTQCAPPNSKPYVSDRIILVDFDGVKARSRYDEIFLKPR